MIILTIHGLVEILCLILRLLIRYAYNILKLEKSILRQWPGYFQVKHIANTFWTYLQFMVFIFLVWSGCMLCNPSSRHLFTAFLLGSIFWSSSLLRTICLPTSCCLHFVLISIYNLVFSYKNNLWSSSLCIWFFSLNILVSRCIYFPTDDSNLSSLMPEQVSIVCKHQLFVIQSSVDGHIGLLQDLAL